MSRTCVNSLDQPIIMESSLYQPTTWLTQALVDIIDLVYNMHMAHMPLDMKWLIMNYILLPALPEQAFNLPSDALVMEWRSSWVRVFWIFNMIASVNRAAYRAWEDLLSQKDYAFLKFIVNDTVRDRFHGLENKNRVSHKYDNKERFFWFTQLVGIGQSHSPIFRETFDTYVGFINISGSLHQPLNSWQFVIRLHLNNINREDIKAIVHNLMSEKDDNYRHNFIHNEFVYLSTRLFITNMKMSHTKIPILRKVDCNELSKLPMHIPNNTDIVYLKDVCQKTEEEEGTILISIDPIGPSSNIHWYSLDTTDYVRPLCSRPKRGSRCEDRHCKHRHDVIINHPPNQSLETISKSWRLYREFLLCVEDRMRSFARITSPPVNTFVTMDDFFNIDPVVSHTIKRKREREAFQLDRKKFHKSSSSDDDNTYKKHRNHL